METQNLSPKKFRGWIQELADQIKEKYDQGFSIREVGRQLEVDKVRVRRYLSAMGYEFSKAEGCTRSSKTRFNDVELTPEALEIIEGNLLGDASLTLEKNTVKPHLTPRSAVYSHTSKSLSHINWLKELLTKNGLPVREYTHLTKAHRREIKNGPNAGTFANYKDKYDFKSVAQPSLKELREKWYKSKTSVPIKIVPENLVLTPTMLLHWYIDDGTLAKNVNPVSHSVRLYTYGFSYDEVFYLKKRLLFDLNLESTVLKRHQTDNQFYLSIPSIGEKNALHFFQLIGPCPPELQADYGHKWPN